MEECRMRDRSREEVMEIVFGGLEPGRAKPAAPAGVEVEGEAEPAAMPRMAGGSRHEALLRRRELQRERAKAEQEARNRASLANTYEALARRPHIAVRSDGIYLNEPAVRDLCRGAPEELRIAGATHRLGAWGGFGGWKCYRAEDVIAALDRGAGGLVNMGRLELLRFESLDDLDGPKGVLIGYARPGAGGRWDASVGIERHFVNARERLLHAPTSVKSKGGDPDALPEQWGNAQARAAWAALDGRPGRGPVKSVRDCVPFEVLLAYASGGVGSPARIVACRSLKYEPVRPEKTGQYAAPFELALEPAATNTRLLGLRQIDSGESWRPKLADLSPFVVGVDPLARKVLYVRSLKEGGSDGERE